MMSGAGSAPKKGRRRCWALIIHPYLSPNSTPIKPRAQGLFYEFKTKFLRSAGMASIAGGAVAAASVSRVAMAALPEPVMQAKPDTMPPLVPNSGDLQPCRDAQRLDLAVAHEQGGQGVPSGRGARSSGNAKVSRRICGATTVRARGQPSKWSRVIAYASSSPTSWGADQRALAWQRLPNGMDGVTGLNQPGIAPGKPLSTSSSRVAPAPSCITRTPMRWCRWRWA